MSWTIQDHADAVLGALRADHGLTVYDGAVDDGGPDHYLLVYLWVQTPDGLVAPDKVKFTGDSDVVDMWINCHCVSRTAQAARGISGRGRAALLNQRLTIPGRTCFPIRWRDGQPPQRSEETGPAIFDQVDVYGLVSVPG